MPYCRQDHGIEPKIIPKTSQKSILDSKRYLLIASQCFEEISLRSLRVQNYSLLERLVQRSVGWRAVFSRIYEVVTSPRQAQVSFDSVIYANVMCHALKMMQNTFTCGHGHLQQLAAFAHVPQKRTRCIHHGPRGATTSYLATRTGGGTMGSRHKAQVVLTFVCALQLVLYKQQQKHICFACFACSIAYSSQQLAHRAVSDCSS